MTAVLETQSFDQSVKSAYELIRSTITPVSRLDWVAGEKRTIDGRVYFGSPGRATIRTASLRVWKEPKASGIQ